MTDARTNGVGRTVALKTYAKINLTLDVYHPRDDGMHPLRSIMQTVELHDTLRLTRTTIGGVRLSITGPEAHGIPTDGANLIVKAVALIADLCCLDMAKNGVSVGLVKNIPSQAGLGGGSSNAAATLKAVCRLFDIPENNIDLNALARMLGSDVPFFLKGGTAIVEGTGEQCRQISAAFPSCPVVIAKGQDGVSTRDAYAALDAAMDRTRGESTEAFLNAQQAGLQPQLHNDFQEIIAAISPGVKHTLDLFNNTSGATNLGPAMLSGSGASVFKLYSNETDARRDAEFLSAAGLAAYVTSLHNNTTIL